MADVHLESLHFATLNLAEKSVIVHRAIIEGGLADQDEC